uniref:Uncharacterized protein n=1 Tax=Coccidioides posadasii RMSCC 3488 TaxID=454284 RepID=A0A0J6I1C4_COCPO|nr:hypothetical protein CPAG_01434 [Coccidioides posadasii RMSCC 3488]
MAPKGWVEVSMRTDAEAVDVSTTSVRDPVWFIRLSARECLCVGLHLHIRGATIVGGKMMTNDGPPYRPIKRMFTFRTSFPNSVPRWSCEEAKTEDMCQQWTIEIPETVTKHMQAPLHWMKEVGQTESSMHLVVLLQTTPFPPE